MRFLRILILELSLFSKFFLVYKNSVNSANSALKPDYSLGIVTRLRNQSLSGNLGNYEY